MREIYPTKAAPSISVINSKPITQEQYNALLAQIQDYETNVDNIDAAFTQLKNDLQSAWTTQTLTADLVNAITACLDNIEATTVQATTVQASNAVFACHFQGTTAYMQCLTTACKVCTPTVNADNVNASCVNTSCVVTDNITVNNSVNYNNTNTACATITNADITCETVFNSEIQTACIYDLNSDTAQVDLACINTAHVTDANVTDALNTYKFNAEFITHNDGQQAQTLVTPDDFYVELPYFSNGSYKLISKDANQEELWSITVHNESGNNFVITWSGSEALDNYLEDLYIYQNRFYFHGHSNNKAQTIYHMSDTTDNVTDPTIYTDYWPFDPTSLDVQKYWVFQFAHGTKFFRNVSFANDTAITSPLRLINCDDVECANLPKTYDTTEDTNVVLYQPDQNVNTTSCVVFNRIETCDYIDPDTSVTTKACATHPHLNVTEDITAPSLNVSCACIDKTTVPNGLVIDCEGTFIKSTGEDTCDYVNPIATLKADECWECADCGLVAYDKNTNSLRPADDVHIVGNLTVECVLTACGPVIACSTLDVACDAHFNGNVSIAGTLTYTNEEVINSTADEIILRQNNPSALTAGQYAGVVVNNSQGSGTGTAIVTDCTGTVRVGNTSGTETTYTDAYLSKTDAKWYSDEDLTTEITPQPSGELTAWDESHSTADYYYYKNAVFTVYSYTNTQPLSTRDEESNLADGAPAVWNAACTRLETNCATCGGQKFVTIEDPLDPTAFTYGWVPDEASGTICRYASMACYLADVANIPANTVVIIDDAVPHVYSEDC